MYKNLLKILLILPFTTVMNLENARASSYDGIPNGWYAEKTCENATYKFGLLRKYNTTEVNKYGVHRKHKWNGNSKWISSKMISYDKALAKYNKKC